MHHDIYTTTCTYVHIHTNVSEPTKFSETLLAKLDRKLSQVLTFTMHNGKYCYRRQKGARPFPLSHRFRLWVRKFDAICNAEDRGSPMSIYLWTAVRRDMVKHCAIASLSDPDIYAERGSSSRYTAIDDLQFLTFISEFKEERSRSWPRCDHWVVRNRLEACNSGVKDRSIQPEVSI